jgi:predicted AAA+ superfamily ATPase
MTIIRDATIKAKKYLLNNEEILIFIGPRQAGKTTILRQLEMFLKKDNLSVFFLNLEDPDYLSLLNKSPKNLFKIFTFNSIQKNFILIDEIQYLNNPSNFLKYFYDEHKEKIKLIVSGSSAFYLDKKFKDSLVGRKRIFYVLTLSFREFLRFKNEEKLLQKKFKESSLVDRERILNYYQEYLIYGGYPRVVLSQFQEKQEILRDIAYSYIKKDIYEANIKQDQVFYKLLKILASQIGGLVNSSELANTLNVSKTAIDNYLSIMEKSFHISLIRPFFSNVRKELIKMPKVYFLDIGLRNFFISNFQPLEIRQNDKGILLENTVFRHFLENYQIDEIKFWRTIQKNEIDFIVGEKAFEIKINPKQFKENNYKKFLQNYPKITFFIVSLNLEIESIGKYKVLKPWEVSDEEF